MVGSVVCRSAVIGVRTGRMVAASVVMPTSVVVAVSALVMASVMVAVPHRPDPHHEESKGTERERKGVGVHGI